MIRAEVSRGKSPGYLCTHTQITPWNTPSIQLFTRTRFTERRERPAKNPAASFLGHTPLLNYLMNKTSIITALLIMSKALYLPKHWVPNRNEDTQN